MHKQQHELNKRSRVAAQATHERNDLAAFEAIRRVPTQTIIGKDVRDILGLPESTARNLLGRLERRGLLRKVRAGVWLPIASVNTTITLPSCNLSDNQTLLG